MCMCVCVCVCMVGYFLCFCLLVWISHTPSLSSCVCGRDEVPTELLCILLCILRASQVALVVKNLPAKAGDKELCVQSLAPEDPLEKKMATDSSILAWRIPWTEEAGRPQFMG